MALPDETENTPELPVGLPPARAETTREPPQPLDYRSPVPPVQRPHRWPASRSAAALLGIGIGVVVTPVAMFLALLYAGGHGGNGFVLGLFPIPLYLGGATGEIAVVLALGVLQFPIYGAAIGYSAATHHRAFIAVIATIALIHFLALAACALSWAF